MTTRMPTVFVSHGAPTFALEPGKAGPLLAALGRELPRPEAILIVSPHWMTIGPQVTASAQPGTIHDFGGFDPRLQQITYPAPGAPALAQATVDVLHAAGWPARAHDTRGLDHGAWVPMLHMYPAADVPVLQVSLPARLDAEGAWAFGQALAPLAERGVLIVGSGSLTHNLYEFGQHSSGAAPYVTAFTGWVQEAIETGDADRLRRTLADAPHAQRAHPTPEHFWPLLVAAGAGTLAFPRWLDGGVAHGMLSMDACVFGDAHPSKD